jgi:AraC family transcriptional regulator of adaptative response / DNA-3-methyladenine glycosylase II
MKIVRSDHRWRVVGFGFVISECLEGLALRRGYRVGAVCDELGVSERYVHEIFLRDLGLTPKEWMRWERMVVARRMLGWGLGPPAVADLLGFSDTNSFRREFRSVYGVSPMRYQENRWPEYS